jgi:GntR family transcriptional regulator
LEKNSSLPLFHQVRIELVSAINDQVYKPGTQLPSEHMLQEKFNVSRLTLRNALKDLQKEGLIYSQPGKGWYVAKRLVNQQLMHLSGFSSDMKSQGMTPSSHVILQRSQNAPLSVAEQLNIQPGTRVARIKRLRKADGVPMACEDAWFPLSLCQDILEQDFSNSSIYTYLESRGLKPIQAIQILTTSFPTNQECKELEIDTNVSIMRMKRSTYLIDTRPIEYVESVYPGDRYQFKVILTYPESAAISGQVLQKTSD